jgi:YVTN family beta-propeller protein
MQHRKKRLFWLVGALFGYALLALAFSMARGVLASQGTAAVGPQQFTKPTYSSPIALSQNNALLWVVNPDDDSVSVIRTDTNAVLRKITVGDEPQSVAVDPSNTFAYVANAADNAVTVIRIFNATPGAGFDARVDTTVGQGGKLTTGAEPWNVVISPDGARVLVANSGQDTLTIINANTRQIIGNYDLRNSVCNDHTGDNIGDPAYHFQPRGLAITQNNAQLYVTRFLSFTKLNGRQAANDGKEGVVCRFNLSTAGTTVGTVLTSPAKITLAARPSGFPPNVNEPAYPNQLQSVVIRGAHAYLPNIASAPSAPFAFNADTQAFVNRIDGIGAAESDGGALNLHLGARDPEPGKTKLFFANPWAIAFTNQSGAGNGYVVSAGSDLLVKVNVDASGVLTFTNDANTTRYIDLNDPGVSLTSGADAGKNPLGIVINDAGTRAYTMNYVSRNVSVVDLASDSVVAVVRTTELPPPDTLDEILQVGKEIFFSSRGHFDSAADTTVATSNRLSSEGWQNCASCHFAGLTDGNVWQFNTGPRKSVPLNGTWNPHNPDDQRILNYSAIFDEVQDFEGNIRNTSGPNLGFGDPNHGLLISDTLNLNDPPVAFATLGRPNAGRPQFTVTLPETGNQARSPIPALDAVKEWVRFAVRTPNGPLTTLELTAGGGNATGGLTAADVDAGRTLFFRAGCQTCHGGGKWTNSIKDFVSPPAAADVVKENDPDGAGPINPNPTVYLKRFLSDIGSFNLNVTGSGNAIPGAAQIGGPEKDNLNRDALGKDHDGNGTGNGFNIPSLLGIWSVPPYYHNGACETLACVLSNQNHRTAKGTKPDVLSSAADQAKVVAFLQSLDAATAPATNLYINKHDIFFDPPAVIAGTTVNVGVNVSLFGPKEPNLAQPLKVTFYDGQPGAAGTTVIGTADLNFNNFDTNFGQATVSVPWNVPAGPGVRFVFVTVDATNLFVEDNERDNTAGRRIRTRPTPPDRTPPVIDTSSVKINDGDAITNDPNVTVTFRASDPASPSGQSTSGVGSFCIVRYTYDTVKRRWVEEDCTFSPLPAANGDGSFTVNAQLKPREGTAYAFVWVKDREGNISREPGFDVISVITPEPIELDRNDVRIFRISLDPGQSFSFTATPDAGDVDLAVFEGSTRVAVSANNGETAETVTLNNNGASTTLFQVEVHAIDNSRFVITTSQTLAGLRKASVDAIGPNKTVPTEPIVSGPPRRAAVQGAQDINLPIVRR